MDIQLPQSMDETDRDKFLRMRNFLLDSQFIDGKCPWCEGIEPEHKDDCKVDAILQNTFPIAFNVPIGIIIELGLNEKSA